MKNLTTILQTLDILVTILAFIFVGIYPYIQEHDQPLADKLTVWYQIAEVLVANETTKTKTDAEKKQTATDSLVNQAADLKIPLNQTVAAGLVQKAYNQTIQK